MSVLGIPDLQYSGHEWPRQDDATLVSEFLPDL